MSRSDLSVIEGEGREPFRGELILRAAADFVDERCQNLSWLDRAQTVIAAARVIVDAEHEF